MENDQLFVEALEDLRHRSSLSATEYDQVRAAGLMRMLVLDKVGTRHAQSLGINPVASWLRMSVLHTVGETRLEVASPYVDPVLSLELGLDKLLDMKPEILHSGSIERFLGVPVLREASPGKRQTSFQHLIRHYANHEGGVHHGRPPKPSLLTEVRGELDEELRLLLIIAGRIVYRALEPALIKTRFSDLIIKPRFEATVDAVVPGDA
ncbi:hypothetical protein JN535_04065 [Cellulosimicrobium cellulans]|uniref:hypothetical protein n=1 Tax=Cellulosimicrobium cellulans TaxID=1710 RepID=UPI0019637226|nr:hypothetical protein [Cellulosimicrobium cellulans]MBN0039349.1 hypothetical protein [Cellulosimicrobium cellulans]